jgi:hypothetical protein
VEIACISRGFAQSRVVENAPLLAFYRRGAVHIGREAGNDV